MGEAGREGQRKRTGEKTPAKPTAIQLSPRRKAGLLDSKRPDRKTQSMEKPTTGPAVFPQRWNQAPNSIPKVGEVVTSGGRWPTCRAYGWPGSPPGIGAHLTSYLGPDSLCLGYRYYSPFPPLILTSHCLFRAQVDGFPSGQ